MAPIRYFCTNHSGINYFLALQGLCLCVAVPNTVSGRKHGNEASAIAALKTISASHAVSARRRPA